MERIAKSLRDLPSVEERDGALQCLALLLLTLWSACFPSPQCRLNLVPQERAFRFCAR